MPLSVIIHPEQNEDVLKKKGVSLNAFFDQVRKRKDNSATVRLRIIHGRFPKYYTTKIAMTEEEYLGFFKARIPKGLMEKRLTIYNSLKKAYDIILELPEFSFDAFDKRFYKVKNNQSDVLGCLSDYSALLTKEERISSASSYDCTKNSLSAFSGAEKLSFSKITPDFLRDYERYMLASGKSITTVGIYCRNLRKIINDAIRKGNMAKEAYPFGKKEDGRYQIPKSRKVKKALSSSDVAKLLAYKPEDNSTEQYCYDLWIFSYLGNGMNLKDICLLKYKNLQWNTIKFLRAKTLTTSSDVREIVVSLIERNEGIIKRWGKNPYTADDYIFPEFFKGITAKQQRAIVQALTKQVNKYLNRIAEKLEIEAHITSYWARHTFSTVLKRSGVNISYISESLGHSSVATTENYLDGFEDDAREAITRKLLEY